ncbi:MAG: hypothetical protein M1429_02205 [Patescibacteria group bacterium]|nr:hypothetical protein [Patescibacteria group bacterium]
MFLKLRKVLIFLVAIAIFNGGFLAMFANPQKAKAEPNSSCQNKNSYYPQAPDLAKGQIQITPTKNSAGQVNLNWKIIVSDPSVLQSPSYFELIMYRSEGTSQLTQYTEPDNGGQYMNRSLSSFSGTKITGNYTDTKVTAEKTYNYQIQIHMVLSSEPIDVCSPVSSIILSSTTPVDNTVPPCPTDIQMQPKIGTASITWKWAWPAKPDAKPTFKIMRSNRAGNGQYEVVTDNDGSNTDMKADVSVDPDFGGDFKVVAVVNGKESTGCTVIPFNMAAGTENQWEMDCGLTTNVFSSISLSWWVGQTLCGVIQGLGFLSQWLIDGLFKGVFDAYNHSNINGLALTTNIFTIPKAYAATSDNPTLSNAFINNPSVNSWSWVIGIWKFVLTLTDLFLVVILLFLGIVNILHIQYDTYAIKKMLPLLIIGVILANFSLLIMRMLIDSSNILTNSFMDGSPGTMVHDLITATKFGKATDHGFFTGFKDGWSAVGILLLGVIFAFFVTAAFLILGVMFYIRYAAILLLGIAAPLAFVAMAFPPTQSLFKQWWSWATKFIYMKPIAMFLLYVALRIKLGSPSDPNGGAITSLVGWFIIVILVYFAIIIPWKLGGAVMSAWGGAMGSIFGTKKGGWARKPVEDWANKKKDIAKGALATRFGNTRLGQFLDRGRKFDDMRLEDYKTRRENQMSDRAAEIKARDERFERTTHEANRTKSRLETRENLNMNTILNGGEAEALKEEEIDLVNAKGDVEQTLANAERGVREGRGHGQNLREAEVARAKSQVDIEKEERDEDIKEGILNNLTAAQISEITGLNIADSTPINVKSRYLEQANRLNLVKERASKRATQDVQIVAERDSRNNNDLRQTMQELLDANRGIDSTYNLDGTLTAPGTTERVSWTQARESAEQLRYRATTAEGAERTRLEAAAQYFDQQAETFQAANATYDATMVTDLDNAAINHEAQANAAEATLRAANPAATAQEIAQVRAPHEARADQAMNASRLIRTRLGQQIDYQNYLTNNLAGRRQKIINPDIADEIHTQVISNPAPSLYQDILDNRPVGSGEARTNQQGIYHVLNGRMNEVDEAGARAAMIQIGAIHDVMKTARHGDSKGLNQIEGFMQVMAGAGRPNFKVTAARRAMGSMNPTLQENMHREALRQAGIPPGAHPSATWAALPPAQQDAALQGLNFEQLDLKTQANSGQRDFVDRFMDQLEADEGLSLGASAGTRSARTRPVDPRRFIENQP